MSLLTNLTDQHSPNLVDALPYQSPSPGGCFSTRNDSAFYLPIMPGDRVLQWYGRQIGPFASLTGAFYLCGWYQVGAPFGPAPAIGYAVVYPDRSVLDFSVAPVAPLGCYRSICMSLDSPTSLFETSPFEVIDNPCFTSIIEFGGCESQLGYPYSKPMLVAPPKYQTARVWAYLDDEQLEEETSVFRGSNGSMQKIFSRVRRKFAFYSKTTYIWRQNALRLAFAHDYFAIKDNKYGTLTVVNEEGLTLEKPTVYPPTDVGSLSGTVYASNFNAFNNYCDKCN